MLPFDSIDCSQSNAIEEDASMQINPESENEDDADLLYTNESLLPQVDWDNLEKQLKQAQVERERYDKVMTKKNDNRNFTSNIFNY